jgi:hypothetical protein
MFERKLNKIMLILRLKKPMPNTLNILLLLLLLLLLIIIIIIIIDKAEVHGKCSKETSPAYHTTMLINSSEPCAPTKHIGRSHNLTNTKNT